MKTNAPAPINASKKQIPAISGPGKPRAEIDPPMFNRQMAGWIETVKTIIIRSFFRSSKTPNRHAHCQSSAFTRIELVAVICVAALLAMTAQKALARQRLASKAMTCFENVQQLGRAMVLYSEDFAGYLPPNPDDGNGNPYRNWVAGPAGVGDAQEFNPDFLTDPSRSLLAPYLNGSTAVFRCPQDPRTGRYQGTNVALKGQIVPAARSYAMNLAVGTNPYRAGGKQPVNGAWLDGNHAHVANTVWFTFARMTDMLNPGPAKTFLFVDEDYRSVNDGMFSFVGPYPGKQMFKMISWPGTYHDMGANLAFADGHAEYHMWQDSRTQLKGPIAGIAVQPNNADIAWLAEHTTALVRQPILSASGAPASNSFNILNLRAPKGASYVLEYTDSLSDPNWTSLPAVMAGTNGPLELIDSTATNAQRFYRAWTQ
jgi:prepilin-type processing-associated H-X9-DG protein